MQSSSRHTTQPFVSWLIPTTLHRHRWWNRLIEFLEDDFPAEFSECLILSTQDEDFAAQAKSMGEKIASSLGDASDHVAKKWEKVRFLEAYSPGFNLSQSRNILLNEARGKIMVHRDADTKLIRRNFTRFAVEEIMRSRLGLLSFPSLQNGIHFKPGLDLTTVKDKRFPDILLANTANGMTTVTLKSIELGVGGRNEALALWGEHTALCTKLARAGFLVGYTDNGYWLTSSDDESVISLTDDQRNPRSLFERQVTIAMLNDFYDVTPQDLFWEAQQSRYKVFDTKRNSDVVKAVKDRYPLFKKQQQIDADLEQFSFKPWDCLSHKQTTEFIAQAYDRATPFFEQIEDEWRSIAAQKS